MIRSFCNNPSAELFSKLNQHEKEFTITCAYNCLNQKFGFTSKAIEILSAIGNIKIIKECIVYQPVYERNMDDIQYFIRKGVITLPVYNVSEIPRIREDFVNTLRDFQEYKNIDTESYVLGGFGAFGNPSSFHNPFVRNIRQDVYKKCSSFFKDYIKNFYNTELKNNYKLEVLFDRMMVRLPGQEPSAELWHRDVVPNEIIDVDDEIYGGWINLDSTSQYFSCVLGSHLNVKLSSINSGFDTFKKQEERRLRKINKNITDEELLQEINISFTEINKNKTIIEIHPGCVVIFPQYILHEVLPIKSSTKMFRLFTGWRLTKRDTSLHNIRPLLLEQSVMPLPSGQIPPMFSKNHLSFFLGIPKESVQSELSDSWITKLSRSLLNMYPTELRAMHNNIYSKNYNKKVEIIIDMINYYLTRNGINILYDINTFNKKSKLSLNTFKTNPLQKNSETTVIKWSIDTFNRNTLINNKNVFLTVKREMNSLQSYGYNLYPTYSEEEIKIYEPHRL